MDLLSQQTKYLKAPPNYQHLLKKNKPFGKALKQEKKMYKQSGLEQYSKLIKKF